LTVPALEFEQEAQTSGFNMKDIAFALFKHKGKIILGTILGVIAAAIVYLRWPFAYESDAKLLVRYVIERSAVDGVDAQAGNSGGKSIENEAQILNSWDLATEVSEAIGPQRLVPELGDQATVNAAGATISGGLHVVLQTGSDIIVVVYRNKDPRLCTVVLEELLNRYFTKHLEVHRSAAAFDFVTQQADQVRARIVETERALRELKEKAGINSVADNTATVTADIIKIEDQYAGAESDVAEQTARVKEIEQSFFGADGRSGKPATKPSPANTPEALSTDNLQDYQALMTRLAELRKTRLDLLTKYTAESEAVKVNQTEINFIDRQKHDMEKKFPDLIGKAPAGTTQGGQLDLASERAKLAGVQARAELLKNRLQEKIKQLQEAGSQIADLERKLENEQANYKYFQNALEKARVDEALDPKKMPNISIVQKPCPPRPVIEKRNKVVLGLAGGGFALSAGLVLLVELFLRRRVSRPVELEQLLGTPLMVSIPYSRPMKRLKAPRKKMRGDSTLIVPTNGGGNGAMAPWEVGHFIRPYAEAIRDRLNLYFELNRMTHKPKLVGVTGFTEGVGASTLAASLAASLSDMGDGKVLLVDTSLGIGGVHPFFEGKPAYPLSTALQPASTMNSASENLYLATVTSPGTGPIQLALKRFFDLMPNLKASDFDYIIFDLPPLNDTTPTLGMARFMDKVLLVVEAEKTGREVVKRGYTQLSAARANVSVVLNKSRSYLPAAFDALS
jgi:uncharacterized protein involved in exopolysaccharide biosynthesis/Mrp family chromosome partitioning ATPase